MITKPLEGSPDRNEENEFGIPKAEDFIEVLEDQGLENHAEAYRKVIKIAEGLRDAGGQALLVGGSVRDMQFGKISKDFDLEIYGLEPEAIEEVVSQHGKISEVGKAFGILKVSFGEGIDIDVSCPRTDSKTGEGHKGFAIKADPDMSIEDAARRRDFTINSMAADPLTGELHDPFNGLEDIEKRQLRVTDPERFKDDPLRVMRALQFVGRFGLSIEPETADIIREMAPDLKELPKERIFEEWKKLLLKSDKPSMGLVAGMSLGVFDEIHPEFPPLAETPQEPEWHPEGDVWIHTLMSVDWAKEISSRQELPDDKALTVILSTLCHDLGKATTTEFVDGRYISHGHEPAGDEPTRNFLKTMGVDNKTRDKVVNLVVNHLAPSMLYVSKEIKEEKVGDGAIRRLAKRISPATIEELVAVSMADHMGRGPFEDPEFPEQLLLPDGFPAGPWLLKWSRELGVEKSKPVDLIRGRDLINLGFDPSVEFSVVIELANRLRDDKNFTREIVLQKINESKTLAEAISGVEQELL
jgi:tRNA nucleotidyltransferase (CCA-adding enzyme)